MLLSLSIRDVVLIDRLDLNFQSGLSVFTDETGAGKSVLLDSLGLVLGERAESGLVRPGASQLSVSAVFDVPDHQAIREIFDEMAMDIPDMLVLRRVVSADGRSRAFLNDQPTSVGLLRRIGCELVEIHGQFGNNRLLDPVWHLALLDAFGKIDLVGLRLAFQSWQEIRKVRCDAERQLAKAGDEEALLRHNLEELSVLSPRIGEEEKLSSERAVLMHGEKLVEAINGANALLEHSDGIASALRSAQRLLERVVDKSGGRLETVVAALDRAGWDVEDAMEQLARISADIDLDPSTVELVERRLFALRALARKHDVTTDGLVALIDQIREKLDMLESGSEGVARLREEEEKAREKFVQLATETREIRQRAAKNLDETVMRELPSLRLEKAVFATVMTDMSEDQWSATGIDAVQFEISTNPGMPMGPLIKIASGGERSRLMLALKVSLAEITAIPTLVFDEVDSGIGGAVAAAVGERLAKLSDSLQVMVVTHSPQVAATGSYHWHVSKQSDGSGGTVTRVLALSDEERREEIARMLSGAEITEQARAAADSLLSSGRTG